MDDFDDFDINDEDHNRLVSAVSKLDKTQHIKEPSRSEPTHQQSEFNLIKNNNKLDLNNVVKVLENTAHHVQISKKLKKTQDVTKVLPKPLEKPQAERLKRSAGYDEAKKKVGRWDAVVARSRTVDYVSFPIKHVSQKMQPTKDFLSKLTSKSSLELELEEVDPKPHVQEEDEEVTYPMSYEEMVEQRQHMAKMRAQQSFKAAKAKRQSKIKSKKYHRILKKEKLKQQLKEFEELQKTDPEEALKKLEGLEKARALERHTLRHKNTGKWAKNKLVRAKYDKEVRQQLAEQLAVSRGLSQKALIVDSSDDEADVNETISELTLAQDPTNPWLLKRSNISNVDTEFDFSYKKYVKERNQKIKQDSDTESEEENKNPEDNYDNQLEVVIKTTTEKSNLIKDNSPEEVRSTTNSTSKKPVTKPIKQKQNKLVATSIWVVDNVSDYTEPKQDQAQTNKIISEEFDLLEDNYAQEVEKKLEKFRASITKLEKKMHYSENSSKNKNKDYDTFNKLSFKNKKIKQIVDEELIETTSRTIDTQKSSEIQPDKFKKPLQLNDSGTKNHINSEANIDPNKFINAKPKHLHSALSEGVNEYDQLDDDEQVVPKVNIEEVFEEDDVVASFRQEKEDEAQKDQPKDIDLSLPGWGSWGGKGVKATKRKKNRFILKAPPKMPRRDDNKGDIIIKEFKDPKLAVHKVSEVPFPFNSVKSYEASIRAPIGNTFIPERAHKLLIKPSIITKAGTVIDPMDEDELLLPKNKSFRNKGVISILSNK